MTRTDIHKPSLLDPADYSYLGCFYQGTSAAMDKAYAQDMAEMYRNIEAAGATAFDGNYSAKFTCDHCGANFAHGACFLHKPTNTYISVGHICASDTIGLDSRASATRKRAEKAAKYEAITAERREQFEKDGYGDVIEYLDSLDGDSDDTHPFLRDMIFNLNKWGSLFPKQAEAVRRFKANAPRVAEAKARRAAEDAERLASAKPFPTGRVEFTGIVLKAEFKDYGMGDSRAVWTVKGDDGNLVWGTIPTSAFNNPDAADETNPEGIQHIDSLKGQRVTFTAAFEVSDRDEHFGFYKRPTKATTNWTKEDAIAA